LSDTPAATTDYPNGLYLVPDTNAFLNGMDLFEIETAFHDVIVLQTVLEEVKNRSLPLYHRLIALTKNEGKRFYVFFNEFRQETHVSRDAGETINDRNDRAVRRAVEWYNHHIAEAVAARSKKQKRIPTVIMITDDKDNLRKAEAQGVPARSCKYQRLCMKNEANRCSGRVCQRTRERRRTLGYDERRTGAERSQIEED
jgi:exosome complex exonuclease DIS3/RRP44